MTLFCYYQAGWSFKLTLKSAQVLQTQILFFQTYFVEVENERLKRVASVSRIYDRVGPILMKLEYLILGTSTGKSNVMNAYYTYWEKKIFKCLVK